MTIIKRKTQGILEYTIMLAAIVAIIVVVMMGQGGIGSKVKSSYNAMGTVMENTVDDITASMSPQAASTGSTATEKIGDLVSKQ